MKFRVQQRGVALLTAMLIVALVTLVGAAMLTHMNIALHRSGNLWQHGQAAWYASGVQQWVGTLLLRDRKHSKIDSLQEAWAHPVPYLPIEGGGIKGQLIDLQGRFNLNNLGGTQNKQATQQFLRLIELVSDVDVVTARTIVQSTRDWIDGNNRPTRPNGAEDGYYLRLTPAYRAANQPMMSPSALRMVRGVTAAIYAKLAPYITTLPEATPINVNTASAPVLASLAANLSLADMQTLVEQRKEQAWESVQVFLQENVLAGHNIPAQVLSVNTHYFLVIGTVTVGRGQVNFFSVLQRGDNGQTSLLRYSENVY